MTDDNDVYTPAQFREHQDGFGHRPPDAHRHTGVIRDPKISRFLAITAENYQPDEADDPGEMPGQYDGLQEVQEIKSIAATETGRSALENGDMPTLKHMTGETNQRADVSGMKAISELRDTVTGPAPMFYIWAEPGSGKTDFAFLLAQLWKEAHGEDAIVASNVRTLMESDPWPPEEVVERHDLEIAPETNDGWLPNFGQLQEWIEQDGTPPRKFAQRPKLFIFDEASSSAGGGGDSGYQTKAKMGPLAYKIRKFGGALIVIGHDGKDVHPLIRELGVAVHKDGKKDATFYDDVKNRDGKGERFRVTGIPPTDWRYDHKEATAWSWSTPDEDEDEEPTAEDMAIWTAIRCKEQGMTGGEIAEFLPYSRSWADTRYREYRDNGKHSKVLAKVEGQTA